MQATNRPTYLHLTGIEAGDLVLSGARLGSFPISPNFGVDPFRH